MASKPPSIDTILERWRNLSPGDRKAVRAHLDLEQRLELDRVLATHSVEVARTAASARRDNKYSAYSSWLGELIADADNPESVVGGSTQPLTPATVKALRDAHTHSKKVLPNAAPLSLISLIRSFLTDHRIRS